MEYSFKLHHYICPDSVNTFSTFPPSETSLQSHVAGHIFRCSRWSMSAVTCGCIYYYILQPCFHSLTVFALRPVLTQHHGRVSNCLSSAGQQPAISCVWLYMYVFPSPSETASPAAPLCFTFPTIKCHTHGAWGVGLGTGLGGAQLMTCCIMSIAVTHTYENMTLNVFW